ncbi:hypothetical protein [uncultured Draconibacterium sp.]|uniref:hypothetical protein n=1 Tax=uncultured Draconibacterium sp. TaxID=1573823 RepID=UPI0029C825CE|nr:hypothetical protein [uncultured Draconibacterium sp.]
MTKEEVNQFEKTQSQLSGLYTEIGLLSKKNPNDAVNKFKLKFINQTISESNSLLGDDYKPFVDFEKFEEEDVPTTSDVTMMLEQYLNCLEKFRSDNIQYHSYDWFWLVNGKPSNIKTNPPVKFSR